MGSLDYGEYGMNKVEKVEVDGNEEKGDGNVKIQTISIRKDQFEFLEEYRKRRDFNFSKFVRVKLDEWIKFVRKLENAKRIE